MKALYIGSGTTTFDVFEWKRMFLHWWEADVHGRGTGGRDPRNPSLGFEMSLETDLALRKQVTLVLDQDGATPRFLVTGSEDIPRDWHKEPEFVIDTEGYTPLAVQRAIMQLAFHPRVGEVVIHPTNGGTVWLSATKHLKPQILVACEDLETSQAFYEREGYWPWQRPQR